MRELQHIQNKIGGYIDITILDSGLESSPKSWFEPFQPQILKNDVEILLIIQMHYHRKYKEKSCMVYRFS